jgi:hypothetical protein
MAHCCSRGLEFSPNHPQYDYCCKYGQYQHQSHEDENRILSYNVPYKTEANLKRWVVFNAMFNTLHFTINRLYGRIQKRQDTFPKRIIKHHPRGKGNFGRPIKRWK